MRGSSYPIGVVCRVWALPRSTHDYQPSARDEGALRQALEAAAQQLPTYGSRRLSAHVRRAPSRLVSIARVCGA